MGAIKMLNNGCSLLIGKRLERDDLKHDSGYLKGGGMNNTRHFHLGLLLVLTVAQALAWIGGCGDLHSASRLGDSSNYLTTACGMGYASLVAGIPAAGIGVPNYQADTPPPAVTAVFLCPPSMAVLSFWAGRVGSLRARRFLVAGTPTRTVPPIFAIGVATGGDFQSSLSGV